MQRIHLPRNKILTMVNPYIKKILKEYRGVQRFHIFCYHNRFSTKSCRSVSSCTSASVMIKWIKALSNVFPHSVSSLQSVLCFFLLWTHLLASVCVDASTWTPYFHSSKVFSTTKNISPRRQSQNLYDLEVPCEKILGDVSFYIHI